jgi:hypothetical protein
MFNMILTLQPLNVKIIFMTVQGIPIKDLPEHSSG